MKFQHPQELTQGLLLYHYMKEKSLKEKKKKKQLCLIPFKNITLTHILQVIRAYLVLQLAAY